MIFDFTTKEIDYIGAVLAERPYREVKDLIDKIVMQANDKSLQESINSEFGGPSETRVLGPE